MASSRRNGPRNRPRNGPRHGQRGFTLVEMMLALAILVFAVTALAGSLMVGVGMRRGTDMQLRATVLVDQVVHEIEVDYFPKFQDLSQPLASLSVDNPPGYIGMKYTVDFIDDPERPAVVLAKIRISWLEQGERMGEIFQRIMIRRAPFSWRVHQLQNR